MIQARGVSLATPVDVGLRGKWYCVHITGHLLILLPCVSIIHQLAICPLQPPIPTPPCPFVSRSSVLYPATIQPPIQPPTHLLTQKEERGRGGAGGGRRTLADEMASELDWNKSRWEEIKALAWRQDSIPAFRIDLETDSTWKSAPDRLAFSQQRDEEFQT